MTDPAPSDDPPEHPDTPEPSKPSYRRRALTAMATVALLNISGLGLGYVLLRRWRAALLCWIATGILLLVAPPAGPNGVPGVALVASVIVLGSAAVHGALRAAWTPPRPPPRPPLAAARRGVLLAVPAGGAVLYGRAHDGDSYTECSYETSLLGSLLPPVTVGV